MQIGSATSWQSTAAMRGAADTRPASVASASRSTEARPPVNAAALAASVGLSTANLNTFLHTGGRLSLTASATGAAMATLNGTSLGRFPMADDGSPDFDAIIAAGGKVTGALPGGYTKMTICDGRGSEPTVVYAAEVDRGDGSAPTFLKGVEINSDGSSPTKDLELLEWAVGFFNGLPNSLSEARARGIEPRPYRSSGLDAWA